MSDDPISPDPVREPDAWPWAAAELPVDLPLEYEAYAMGCRPAYLKYAQEVLGDQAVAEEVVHQVLTQIAIDWAVLLRESSDLADATWSMLSSAVNRAVIVGALQAQLAENVAAARAVLASLRESLLEQDADDTECGLFPALRLLSDRQFDVVILKGDHKLTGKSGFSTFFTAHILGMHPSTVDRNHARALTTLEEALRPRRILKHDVPRPRRSTRGARR